MVESGSLDLNFESGFDVTYWVQTIHGFWYNHSSNEKQQNLQSKQKNAINNNKRDTSLPRLIRSASITSNESDNIDQMMMMIMNTTNKTNWPILKIDDSIKGSTNDLEVNLQIDDSKENNNNIKNDYIKFGFKHNNYYKNSCFKFFLYTIDCIIYYNKDSINFINKINK